MRFTPSIGEGSVRTPNDVPTSVIEADVWEIEPLLHRATRHPVNKDVGSSDFYLEDGPFYFPDWYGGIKDAKEALKIAEEGWQEGADLIAELAVETQILIKPVGSIEPVWKMDDHGDRLDWEAALAGEWDTAYRRRKMASGVMDNVVTLLVQVGGNCGVTAEQMKWTGLQGLLTARILEDAGYRVDLRGVALTDYPMAGSRGVDMIRCKEAEDPLRLDLLAAHLAHAGIFRTVWFAMKLMHDRKIDSSLGRTIDYNQQEIIDSVADQGLIPTAHVFIPQALSRHVCLENVRKALSDSMERVGQAD